MKAEDAVAALADKEFLDKLYGFAYRRCNNSHEAEDICADILLAVLKSIRRGHTVGDFYPYVWSVAHRVCADYYEQRRIHPTVEWEDGYGAVAGVHSHVDEIERLLDDDLAAVQLKQVMREIAFLSKIYRDVMVMYYLEERKTAEIARCLGITENTVKQRLFSARNTIKKGVGKMNTKLLSVKPIQMICHGDGDPVKSYPFKNVTRSFSQNLVYLCREKERSAKEIAEILGVPMAFVEDELAIQCYGSNGSDGLLRKLDNGKYISTFIMLDYADYQAIQKCLCGYLDDFTDRLEAYINKNRERILSFPFLNRQADIHFILWSLVNRMCWSMGSSLSNKIIDKYYKDTPLEHKAYYPFGFIVNPDEEWRIDAVGCDGVNGKEIGGYKQVYLCNIYDRFRKQAHFHCDLNIANTPYILMTIRSVGGLDIHGLTEDEKEIAASAIANGFMKREGDIVSPKILVLRQEDADDFYSLAGGFYPEVSAFADGLVEDFNGMIKRYLPGHLYGQVNKFINHTTCGFESDVIGKCIERGILYQPESLLCAEGTFMVLQK